MVRSGERIRVFLTVGSQMPFDRLVAAVAAWAQARPAVAVVAQVGQSSLPAGTLEQVNALESLPPAAYLDQCRLSDLIVAHAGMGSILTALELDKPLVVMPRRGALRETRNDHQFDTARHLMLREARAGKSAISVAMQEDALPEVLDRACGPRPGHCPALRSKGPAPESAAQAALRESLRAVILRRRRL